ncbi:condensation domain-containing protein, partial [Ascidiimonas sp. W6]|uniref:condensation domain-containing protein n=1 Tax=Ascidiimonas meishanensis TaxID=3128903 RepID=UPI0030ED6349
IPKVPEQGYYVLSSAQQRMYFLYEFDKASLSYNMPGIYRLTGELDVPHLKACFHQLVDRHESLRTFFEMRDSGVVQRIVPAADFEVLYKEGSSEDMQSVIDGFVRPFELCSAYPFRVALYQFAPREALLLIDMHHIISDGVSHQVLLEDFCKLYQGESLAPLSLQYRDYAHWQQDSLEEGTLADHRSYWLSVYKELPSQLSLPTDYPRPLIKTDHGRSTGITIEGRRLHKLRALAQEEGVTMYMLLLALYTLLLRKLSNQEDIVVGTPTSGRHHADLEGMVGMFVNTLALRYEVSGDQDFRSYLSLVKRCTLGAFDHQLYQYETLVEELGIDRDTSRNPLFDV